MAHGTGESDPDIVTPKSVNRVVGSTAKVSPQRGACDLAPRGPAGLGARFKTLAEIV
jgi:hypothetical protein